jgi:membrane fusion protein (multidrug efflux system)
VSQRPETATPVSAVLPTRASIEEITRTDERIVAENRVEVTTEVLGRCIAVKFEEGDKVKKGQVLVELDKTEQLAQLRQQKAQELQAERDFDRMKKLFAAGIKSEEEYDSVWSSLQQQRETVNQTNEQLAKYTIRAPISGTITTKAVQLGEIVSSGNPIFTVIDPNSFMLTVAIEESELPRLVPGQRALVTVDALGDEILETKVRRVGQSIDEASGTVSVILDFAKEDIPKLRESAFARVQMIMDTHENALLVPKEAIVEENARTFVFVVRELSAEDAPSESGEPEFRVQKIEVSIGLENSDFTEVLDGVNDGDRVVTYGQHTLKSESRIRITTPEYELDTAAAVTAEEALEIAQARKSRGTKSRNMYTPGK